MLSAAELCILIMLGWIKAHDSQEHSPLQEYIANEMTMKKFVENKQLSIHNYKIGKEFNKYCYETFAADITEDDLVDDKLPFDK